MLEITPKPVINCFSKYLLSNKNQCIAEKLKNERLITMSVSISLMTFNRRYNKNKSVNRYTSFDPEGLFVFYDVLKINDTETTLIY